ncbi:MAG: hypothetical protein AAB612_01700, partial [Patescibacteria group bacterium]
MKQNPMILLPIVLVVIFGAYLGLKWWRARVEPLPKQMISENAAVDERNQTLLKNFKMTEQNTVQLRQVNQGDQTYGVVRWSDDKASLTVVASLPILMKGSYRAWISDGQKTTNLGMLRMEKGGYLLDYTGPSALSSTFTGLTARAGLTSC